MEIRRVVGEGGKQLEVALKHLQDKVGRVGWFEGAKYDDDAGTQVAMVAAQNEYGNPSKNIPARPFMRPTIKAKENAWRKIALDGSREVLKNRVSITDVMEGIGQQAAGDIKATIRKIYEPPLSQRTIQARISRSSAIGRLNKNQAVSLSKPLIDTGHMLNTLINTVDDA